MTHIGDKMASGAIWMVLAKLVERSLGLISMLILARVLVPHDFGIVAMAMSFVALLEMVSAFGFDMTLIQKQTKERRHWDTAWTFDILVGIGLAVIMVAGAGPVAAFFGEAALVDVIRVLAIGSAVQGFQNIGLVAFRTEMRFDREFKFLTAKKLIGFGITIPLAIWLDSYWALVIGQTASRIGGTVLSYWMHPYRPRLSLAASGELFHFSKWLLIINGISYMKERSSDWVIGRMAGPASLGAFNMSYELTSLPSSELMAPINRAVFPAYARLAAEGHGALRREYLSVISVIVLLAVPAVFGLASTAQLLVPVMLGPNWSAAIPVLTLLAFFGFTHIIQGNAQAAYLALGRADIPAKVNGLHVAVQLAALIPLTSYYGVVGSAAAYLLTAAVMIPLSLGVVLRILKIRVLEFAAQIWRPITAAAVMYVAVHQYIRVAALGASGAVALAHLLSAIGIGVITYLLMVTMLWVASGKPQGAERMAFGKGIEIAARLRPARTAVPRSP